MSDLFQEEDSYLKDISLMPIRLSFKDTLPSQPDLATVVIASKTSSTMRTKLRVVKIVHLLKLLMVEQS